MKQEYLAIIRYALDEKAPLPSNLDNEEWRPFFQYCSRQGILGVVFAGIERADRGIPRLVLLEWFGTVQRNKVQNALVNKRLHAITEWFEDNGLRSVILKGQVNGLMYPEPDLRSPGDIDIWVDCEKVKLIKLVMGRCPDADYSIHHVKMPIFNDVTVEVHYRPIYLINWFKDRKLQQYVNGIEKEQFDNHVLLDGKEVGSLTNDFNVLYQLLHMYAHFFSTRNCFKQFVDYYYLLKQGLSEEQKVRVVEMMKSLGVLKYAKGMMWIMTDILGLEKKYLVVEPSERVGKVILNESERHYGKFSLNKVKYILQRFTANRRLVFIFPSQVLISPLFLIWHQWWKLKIGCSLRRRMCEQ